MKPHLPEVRVLLIEDSVLDAELIEHELVSGQMSFHCRRVDQMPTLREALAQGGLDLILSDLNMPSIDSIEALRLAREMHPTVPFIYVSGSIGEERAIELLRLGATDYVHKDHLGKLTTLVDRALREAETFREQQKAQAQLRKLSQAIEYSPVAIIITDAHGNMEYVNPKFAEVTGYSVEEALGHRPRIFMEGSLPQVTADKMWNAIRAGAEWRGEFRNVRKDGEQFWEFVSISSICDDAGAITHYVILKEDVTERKRLEEQLLRTQRLESIGTLASGVAHDLNNVLSPILMAVPLLEPALRGTRYESLVSTIKQSAERGAGIVRQVLTFARGVEGDRGLVQVSHLLRELESIAVETFPRSIQVRTEVRVEPWPVLSDATHLHQILLNLCVNARDAMPTGGVLKLSAENVLIDESYASMAPEANPGPYLMLAVSDSGHGIPDEIKNRIFDPFFTTKELGKGTGLGLSTVIGIVRSHSGFVRVESQVGHGTTFKVFLPAEPDGAALLERRLSEEPPDGNGEWLLFVDDEPSIRSTAKRLLEDHGYHVATAADGVEGMALFAKHQDEIALLITDLAMPALDGPTLIRGLRELQPELPVIFSTGQGFRAQVPGLRVEGFLGKPYDCDALLRLVHDVLQRHPPRARKSPARTLVKAAV